MCFILFFSIINFDYFIRKVKQTHNFFFFNEKEVSFIGKIKNVIHLKPHN